MKTFLFHFNFILFSLCLENIVALKVDDKARACRNLFETTLKDVTSHFSPGQLIHIAFSDNDATSCFLDDFLSKHLSEKLLVIVTQKDFQERVNRYAANIPDAFLIFFNSHKSLIRLCDILSNDTASWNPGAKFLTVTTASDISSTPVSYDFVIDIFNFLWSRNIFRVSSIIYNTSIKTAVLFSSPPYSKQYNICKKITASSQLQEINLIDENISFTNIVGFKFNPPKSFFGCPLVAHTIPFPPYSVLEVTNSSFGHSVYMSGVDIQLVRLMAKLYNFSLQIFTSPNYGNSSETHEMMENVRNFRIDLAFSGFIPSANTFYRYSLSNSYLDNSMSWYVPGAEIIPIWKLVLNTFSGKMWIFMLIMLLLVTTLYILMSGMKMERSVELSMIALTLGFSIPWTKKPLIRIILVAWSLFSFHVTLMFTTRLFSVLTAHPVDPGVTTIQQLYGSKFQVCTISRYKNFYSKQTDGLLRDLLENAEICSGLEDSVKTLLKYRNISVLVKDDFMSFLIDMKKENVQRLREKFINYPVSMSAAKDSVFMQYLNRLILNVTESGLVLKWLNNVRLRLKPKLHSKTTEQEGKIKGFVLTNEDFSWFFAVFICGLGITLLVFVFEILIKNKKSKI